MKRRDLLKLGAWSGTLAATGAVGGLLAGRPARGQMHGGGGGSGGTSPPTTPFAVALPIPATLSPTTQTSTTDYYEITMRSALQEIIPGLSTTIWGYEGTFPGPVIRARSGRRVVMRQINALPEATTVHLHGGNVPADQDGHPVDLIEPGSYRDYTYPNDQIAATLWFHDHAHERTGSNVWMGLAGLYVLGDEVEDALPLPEGEFDVPLVIQDRLFDSAGQLVYPLSGMTIRDGVKGDTLLVNGAVQPFFEVADRKYRFRLLNGSNSRIYELALDAGDSLLQIGTDGGLLPHPVPRAFLPLAPGERAEVVIDFAAYPIGSQVVLKNRLGSPDEGNGTADVLRFDVTRSEADGSSVPADLRPLQVLDEADAVRTRTIDLEWSMHGGGGHLWVLDGQPFDPARTDFFPRLGDVEIWHFQNRSGHPHPMHIHDDFHQILEVDGRPPDAGDAGWKDTTLVPPWSSARVIIRFTDHLGTYVYHCHNLEHEDWAMMAQFQVLP